MIPAMSSERLEAQCGWCGAPVALVEDQQFVTCDHCGASLVLDLHGQRPTYWMPPGVRENDLGGVLKRWLLERDIRITPVVRSTTEVLVPFWRVEHEGQERFAPAVASPRFRTDGGPMPQGELKFFNPEGPEGPPASQCLAPDVPPDEAAYRLGVSPDHPASLVYIPVFEVQYSLRNRTVHAVMEAVTGRVWHSVPDLPATGSYLDRRLGAAALGVLGIQIILAAIFRQPWLSVAAVLLFMPVSKFVLQIAGARESASKVDGDG